MDNALRRLTLHQLRVFRTVARLRSFTQAAAELGLTQSAVSAQMRELAGILGTPLVEVIARRVHLTDAGRVLESQAALVEGDIDEISRHFAALRGADSGVVRVGASSSVGTYVLPALVADFGAHHPGVEVSLAIHNSALIEEGLLRNEFDLGFTGTRPTTPELVAEHFLEDEIFFACGRGHPLAGARKSVAKRVGETRLLVREPGSGTRRTMEAHLHGLGVSFRSEMQIGAVEAIKQAVIAGLGIAYLSGITVRDEIADGRLVRLAAPGLSVRRNFLTVRHRRKQLTPALKAFLEFAGASRG